jgi:hypothetical protein
MENVCNCNCGSKSCHGCHRFHILCFGLALGIVWGVGVFLMGISAMFSGWGIDLVKLTGTTYLGYQPTWIGSLIGGLWGFVDAFIGGVIFAAIYNALGHCCKKRNKQVITTTNTTPPTFSQH